jgi:hypothetical protein
MKRLAVFLLLALAALSAAGALAARPEAAGPTRAAAPPPVQQPLRREGRGAPVVAAPPWYTTAPSPLRPLTNPAFDPNQRANTDATTYAQQEPSIAVNPLNPLNIIASAKDERSAPAPNTATKEVWEYTSTDGGLTWLNQHAPIVGTHAVRQSDPVNIFRDDGVAYACYLGYNDSSGYSDTGIYVTRSTDGGLTWNNTVLPVNEGSGYSTDKQWLAVDNNPASPYYHRMYLSWTEFGGCNGCIHFVYSTDGGVTWSSQSAEVLSGAGVQFSMPTVLWNGNVFVNWAAGSSIVARISTDGGVTFGSQFTAGSMNTNLSMPGRNWRISAIPVAAADRATPGNLVITWNDGRNNAANGVDVYYTRSTNGGTTWSAPARLNDDPAGVVKQQAEPWVTTSPNGVFHAIWYDEREDSAGAPILLNTYYSQSTDAGATWSPNVRVSDGVSDLNVGIPQGPGWNGAAGDYINLSATDTDVYGVWTDTRSGTNEDIYMVRGRLTQGTPTPTVTGTPPTATRTATTPPTNTATRTASPTATTPPTNTAPPTLTQSPPSATATSAAGATATGTSAPAATATTTSGPAATSTATAPPQATATAPAGSPTVTATPCVVNFSDVHPTDYFYIPVQYLACHGVISGYADGTFRPYNNTTRSQMVKIVALAFHVPGYTPPNGYTFTDVPPANPFFSVIEAAAHANVVSGYACGGTGEPCDSQNRPYFRPFADVTRGQLAKIVAVAAAWTLINPTTPTFADVLPNTAFYTFVETAYCHGVISGYTCGGPGEPCDGQSRPYYRQYNNATRGQIAKIVYGALTAPSGCALR